MKTIMSRILNEKDHNTVDQVQQFLIGTQLIAFQIKDRYRLDFKLLYTKFRRSFPASISFGGYTPKPPRYLCKGDGWCFLPPISEDVYSYARPLTTAMKSFKFKSQRLCSSV